MTDTLTSPTSWQWPLNLDHYDRRPQLTTEERAELDSLQQRRAAGNMHWQMQTAETLQRLLQPLDDVLTLTGASTSRRYHTVGYIIREMTRLEKPYWSWSTEDWIDCLTVERGYFKDRFGDFRIYLMAAAYLLGDFTDFKAVRLYQPSNLAAKIFGQSALDSAVAFVSQALHDFGYTMPYIHQRLPQVMGLILLTNRSPCVEALDADTLEALYHSYPYQKEVKSHIGRVARVLHQLGLVARPVRVVPASTRNGAAADTTGIAPEWADWCLRWFKTSTLTPEARRIRYYLLLKVGRWLAEAHPEIVSPAQWTRELAADYLAAVDRMRRGDYTVCAYIRHLGQPLSPAAKSQQILILRSFLRDCQAWGWIPIRFDPGRYLATPRTMRRSIQRNPRVIADDVWAKLLWAGMNLTLQDLPTKPGSSEPPYSLEMVRALAMIWLFAGLRSDEIHRLRVGCIRWQTDTPASESARRICLLDVPVNKTSTAFTKPVDALVGEAVQVWEQSRGPQAPLLDPKTGEMVQYLFVYRGKRMAKAYLNARLIPLLCHKAGVPEQDARGTITSHRARSTIASQLFNAREPMSLFELQAWLGHSNPNATQFYTRITPTKLVNAYRDAGYFGRNLRTIEVLIDQEAVTSGAAAQDLPWKYYDLGHGYCTYDFFDQCPHRMACARCAFYRPKASSQGQLLEAKSHLQRMLQEIPLTDDERAAVDDGLEAVAKLSAQLLDIPTPAGPTPRQLTSDFVPLAAIEFRSTEKG
jgi:integrase